MGNKPPRSKYATSVHDVSSHAGVPDHPAHLFDEGGKPPSKHRRLEAAATAEQCVEEASTLPQGASLGGSIPYDPSIARKAAAAAAARKRQADALREDALAQVPQPLHSRAQ